MHHLTPQPWSASHLLDLGSNVTLLSEQAERSVLTLQGLDGTGQMTAYAVFPGIYLVFHDYHMTQCQSEVVFRADLFCIDHCREGRMEMCLENGNTYYTEQGDLQLTDRPTHRGTCYFPLSHYRGITIAFQKGVAERGLKEALPGFSLDLEAVYQRFCNGSSPYIIHKEPAVEHLFYQLYELTEPIQPDYLKVKVMELLLYLNSREFTPYQVEKPYFQQEQIEKIRAIHTLITKDLTRTYTAQELSDRFSISLTALKRCFKSIYGSPLYTYLRQYRIRQAAQLLLRRPDLKTSTIGTMVGYDSASKFTAVFHELMGKTPLEYRKFHELEGSI